MKNLPQRKSLAYFVVACSGAVAATALSGCGKKAPPPPPPVATNTEPAKPAWSLEDLDMDPRVQFPESRLPSSQELAQAIADLASAIATGDHDAMQPLLDPVDREVLKDLVSTGDWKAGTTGIEAVRVCVLIESDDHNSARVGLGVQDVNGAYMLAWTAGHSSPWRFQAMSILPLVAERVVMLDDKELIEPPLDFTTVAEKKPEPKPAQPTDTPPVPDTYDDDTPINPPSDDPFQKPVGRR